MFFLFLQLIKHNLATIGTVVGDSDNFLIFWPALAGQPFFRGAGRGGAGRTSLLGRSRKKNLCKKASQIKITFEAAALLPARVVILICEHIAATEGAPSPQPDMAAPSLITAFTPLPPNAPGRGFFWKPTAWLKINVLDNSSQAGSAICHLSP